MSFWEISGLVLSAVQLGVYIDKVGDYKEKLETYADYLETVADNNRAIYEGFRNSDPSFYSYYQGLPSYSICNSSVHRSKGASLFAYGNELRSLTQTTRGYSQLEKVHINNMAGNRFVAKSALDRGRTHIKERARQNDHTLERWAAIVSAPVGVERYQASAMNNVIESSFRSLTSASQGFNSAGISFGIFANRTFNSFGDQND